MESPHPMLNKHKDEYALALIEQLYILADDDLMTSHRASEWLGLAPHIEEDVAFSSITQNTLGHAVLFFELLQPFTHQTIDDMAYLRRRQEYRFARLVARPNGTGHYMEQPVYDWGYTVVRQLVYETFKRVRLSLLKATSYKPLAQAVEKVLDEQYYHFMHWKTWFSSLANSTEEARERLKQATIKVWMDIASLFDLGPLSDSITGFKIGPDSDTLKQGTLDLLQKDWTLAGLTLPVIDSPTTQTGREGKHDEDAWNAILTMSEVYRLAPQARW